MVLLLAGCSSPELQTTSVDVARAFNAAQDPWAAAESLSFPSQEYGGGNVLRDAGSRSTNYPGLPARRIAKLEIAAAQDHGWTLASVQCTDEGSVEVSLTRGEALDYASLALGTFAKGSATVLLKVPHHLDGSWPDTTAITLEESCLAGGGVNSPPTVLPYDPYPGEGTEPSLDNYQPWQRDALSEEEQSIRKAVMSDPFVASLGLDLLDVSLRTGDNWRREGSASTLLPGRGDTTRASVAAVVADMPDWDLTWATCGADLPSAASLMLRLDGTIVTARVASSTPEKVSVRIGLPTPEVPSLDTYLAQTPVLSASRCLSDQTSDKDLGRGILVEGTPVALPGSLHPYLGG